MQETEYGCALSHIMAYRMIDGRGISYSLILEDDAIPMLVLVRFMEERHYEDADLCGLSFSQAWVCR